MTTRDYLEQIQRIDIMLSDINQDIERYKNLATSITVPMGKEKVQSSGVSDIVGNNVVNYLTLQNQGNVAYWLDVRNEMVMQIRSMPIFIDYKVLFEKYVNGKDVGEISSQLGKTRQHIDRLLRVASEHFEHEYGTSFKLYF